MGGASSIARLTREVARPGQRSIITVLFLQGPVETLLRLGGEVNNFIRKSLSTATLTLEVARPG